MKLVSCIAVVTVAAITASGCGPRAPVIEKHYVNPVEGQVIWKGKPLGNAKVTFNPNGWKLHAFTTLPVGFTVRIRHVSAGHVQARRRRPRRQVRHHGDGRRSD